MIRRLYRRWFYKLPWPQEEWSALGLRLLALHLANMNRERGIEPMEKR